MTPPTNLSYTTDHEWLLIDGDVATVGITAFAAELLGDIVYVALPSQGTQVLASDPCGEIESTKAVSDIFSPVEGTVLEANTALSDDPSIVNREPYGHGWLFRAQFSSTTRLLNSGEYLALIGEGS